MGAIFDPRCKEPLLLATNLTASAEALWRLYRDRRTVEPLPRAAKPMSGAERAFVSGAEGRFRLPEWARLAGSLLSYVAATTAPVASGFWDRASAAGAGKSAFLGVCLRERPTSQKEPCDGAFGDGRCRAQANRGGANARNEGASRLIYRKLKLMPHPF